MGEITSIAVDYKNVDGWHVFTSDSLPGLYVASTDAETAYNDVGLAIETLVKLDFGMTCEARPEVPFRSLAAKSRPAVRKVESAVPAMRSRRFALVECRA